MTELERFELVLRRVYDKLPLTSRTMDTKHTLLLIIDELTDENNTVSKHKGEP